MLILKKSPGSQRGFIFLTPLQKEKSFGPVHGHFLKITHFKERECHSARSKQRDYFFFPVGRVCVMDARRTLKPAQNIRVHIWLRPVV